MPSFIVRGRIIANDKSDALRAFMAIEGAKWAEVEEQMELPFDPIRIERLKDDTATPEEIEAFMEAIRNME